MGPNLWHIDTLGMYFFNRPSVAGAVLQSPLLLTDSLSDPFVQDLGDTVNPKP